jgi:biotin--protein ligase
VSTPAPVTALDLLCKPGEHLDAETVLALVLTEFERLWTAFVAGRGSWAPFEEAYLDVWMHSYVFHPPRSMCLMDGCTNVVTNS